MADIGAPELPQIKPANALPAVGEEFPVVDMRLPVGGKPGDMSGHTSPENNSPPSVHEEPVDANPEARNDSQGVKVDPEEILRFWGVLKEGNSVAVEMRQGKRNLFKREAGEPYAAIVLRDENGKTIREYNFQELQKLHENRLKKIETERLVKTEEFRYQIGRNRGQSFEELGYRTEPASPTSGEVVVIDNQGHRFTQGEFERHLKQDKPGITEQIKNLAKMRGNKTQGFKEFITKETRFGRAVGDAFGAREMKRDQKAFVLAARQLEAEKQGSRLKQTKNAISRGMFAIGRPFSFAGAATRATVGMLAYDYNPLRPLFGATVGRAWTADWGKLIPQGELHDKVQGLSFRELAGRLEEKFLTDPITGEPMRTPAISEKKLRQATTAGVEWGLKMQLLPNVLSQMPAIAALNLNPGEIWSMYRSANMVRNSPGSVKQFYELLKHADSKGEQAKLIGLAAVSAPLFLAAEKAAAGGVVNPVLMFDVGIMRFAAEAKRYMAESGMVSTKFFKALEAIETGITGAFTFDSLVSVTQRVEAYIKTGKIDPLSKVKTEQELLGIIDSNPHLAMGESSMFGWFQRAEHAILSKIRPDMAVVQRMVMISDEQGGMVQYSIVKEHEEVRIIRTSSDGIAVREKGNWITIPAVNSEEPNQMNAQDLIGLHKPSVVTELGGDNISIEEDALQQEVTEAQAIAEAILEESLAVHDYAVFSEDEATVAIRLDLAAVDGQAEPYESVADKVERLFSHVTPEADRTIDDEAMGLTGEQVQSMEPGSYELEFIAGKDKVFEAQIQAELVDRLISDAGANGLTFDLNLVKTRMVAFLEQGFIDERTIEGEIEYASLYRYLFADSQMDFSRVDQDALSQKAYFLTDRDINPEIRLEIESGSTVGQLLNNRGYKYADLVKETDTKVYKVVDGERLEVSWSDLDNVYGGDVYIIDRNGDADDVELDLPEIRHEIIDESEVQAESPPEAESFEPLPDIPTLEYLKTNEPLRAPNGEIYIGEVQSGQYVGQVVNDRFAGYIENPWTNIYRAFVNGEVELYTVDDAGNKLRDFRLPENDIGVVFTGEQLVVNDAQHRFEGIENYEARVEAQRSSALELERIQENQLFTSLENELSDELENFVDHQVSVALIDPNDPQSAGLVFNGDLPIAPGSMENTYIAMLVLKEVERGNWNLNDRSAVAVRSGNYVPTVGELVRQAVIYSDEVALDDLVEELLVKYTATGRTGTFDAIIKEELGMEQTHFGDAQQGDQSETTASDLMTSLRLLHSGRYLSPENSAYLLSLLRGSGQVLPIVKDTLEKYPGVSVSEQAGILYELNSPDQGMMGSLGLVQVQDGRSFLYVISAQGSHYGLNSIIEQVSDLTLTTLNTGISSDYSVSAASQAYNLESKAAARRDYIDHFLFPLFNVPGETETINPEIAYAFGGGQVPAQFSQWSSTMQTFADATVQASFQDPQDPNNTALFWLDPQQQVVLGLSSESANQAGFRLVDWHGENQLYEFFAESDFEASTGKADISIAEINPGETELNTDTQRQAFIETLQESELEMYDFMIFPGGDGEPPIIAYTRPSYERSSGAIPSQMRIGVLNEMPGIEPNISSQEALSYLFSEFESWQDMGKFQVTSVNWEWGGEIVEHQNLPLLTQERWYTGLSQSIHESLIDSENISLVTHARGDISFSLSPEDAAVLTNDALTFSQKLEQLEAISKYDVLLHREYDQFLETARVSTALLTRTIAPVEWEDFRVNFWQSVTALEPTQTNAGVYEVEISRETMLATMGVDSGVLDYQGNRILSAVYVPQGTTPDFEHIANTHELSKDSLALLPTRDATIYLVGEKIADSLESDASYEIPANQFLYQYQRSRETSEDYALRSIGGIEYLITSQPVNDPTYQLSSVVPLQRPLETYAQVGPIIPVGSAFVQTQYQQDAYFVESGNGQAVDVLVDQRSLRVYGQVEDDRGNFSHLQALVGHPLSYEEIATALNITPVQADLLIPTVIEHRLMQSIELLSETSHSDDSLTQEAPKAFYQVRDGKIIDLSTQGTGEVQTYSLARGNAPMQALHVDEQFNLRYQNQRGESFIFDRGLQQFVRAEEHQFEPLHSSIGDNFKILTIDDKPLAHKGMPLFVGPHELIYTLDATGLIAVDTLYSKGAFETTQDERLFAMLKQWGVEDTLEWQEERTFTALSTPEEKLLHQVAMIDNNLIETSTGLFDPASDTTFVVATESNSRERLVDRASGKTLLAPSDKSSQVYALDDDGNLERFSGFMVTEAEYIKRHRMEAYAIEEQRSVLEKVVDKLRDEVPAQSQLIDRTTRLPIYTIGDLVLVFGPRGLEDMGSLSSAMKNGFVGLDIGSGEFDTLNPETLLSILGDSEHYSVRERVGMIADLFADTAIEWLASKNQTVGHISDALRLTQGADYVAYDQLPRNLVHAIIASEDERLLAYDSGEEIPVNMYALFRAALSHFQSGASNIPQQLGRNVELSFEERSARDVWRKVDDWMRAAILQEKLTPEEILELYVNVANYGADGIAQGSQQLFGKELHELSLEESVLLTVMPKNPGSFSLNSYESALLWADMAAGVTRRMRDNGIIDDSIMTRTWKGIYNQVLPSGLESDIAFLQKMNGFDDAQLQDLKQLAIEYQRMDWEKRWIDDPNSTDPADKQYVDFFTYAAQQNPGILQGNGQNIDQIIEGYYSSQELAWQPKFEGLMQQTDLQTSSQVASLGNFNAFETEEVPLTYLPKHLREGRTSGPLLADVMPNDQGMIALDPLSYRFEAMQKDASGAPEVMPVIATTEDLIITRDAEGQLWKVSEQGLERLPSELYVVHQSNGNSTVIQSQPANLRPSAIFVNDDTIDANKLIVDAAGNYYQIQSDSREALYIGRAFTIGNQEVLVRTPAINEFVSSPDQSHPTWAAIANGYSLYAGASVSVTDFEQAITQSSNPNLGALPINGRNTYDLINPQAVHSALNSLQHPSTVIEMEASSGSQELFKQLVQEAVENKQGVVVWWKPSQDMTVMNVNPGELPLYEQIATQERPVTILGSFTHDGREHVLFDDPNQTGIEQAEWSQFMRSVAPTQSSSMKALILDDIQLPESYEQYAYEYNSPSRQLEMAWYDPDFSVNWNSPNGWFERMMTNNASMQQWVESEAKSWMSPTTLAFRGMAMDGHGNVVFATGINQDGSQIGIDDLFAQAFTPGSVFKIPTVLWGLHHGLDPNEQIQAGDSYELPWGSQILNWTATYNEYGQLVRKYGFSAPSTVTPGDLLKYSSNTAAFSLYYNRDEYLDPSTSDPDSLLDYTAEIGFGASHEIPGMPNNGGVLPTDDYAIAHPSYGAPLDPVFHGQQAFGQHDVQVTLPEMLRLVGAIANDGAIIEPNLVRGEESVVYGYLPNDLEDLRVVQEGMHDVAMESGGTAFHVFGDVKNYTVYGKTGTAEMGEGEEPHAWFVGWAEDKNTGEKLIFSFMFEHGGEGSRVAAPAVREMLDKYFSNIPLHAANDQVDQSVIAELERMSNPVAVVSQDQSSPVVEPAPLPEVETQIAMEMPNNEELIASGTAVDAYARSTQSFLQLGDRSVSRNNPSSGQPGYRSDIKENWHYFNPEGANAAGALIEQQLRATLPLSDDVSVERLEIGERYIPFRDQSGDQPFDVIASIGPQNAARTLVITSHYDTRPDYNLGNQINAEGASDNGWSVIMNMQLAQSIAEADLPDDVRIVFAFTSAEEIDYDNMDPGKRAAGAQVLRDHLLSEGALPESITVLNMDGLVNLQNIEGTTLNLFNPVGEQNSFAVTLSNWLTKAGIIINESPDLDRVTNQTERWGDQVAFYEGGIQQIVRLTDAVEPPLESEDDQLPDVLDQKVLLRTGSIMWALKQSLLEFAGVPIQNVASDPVSQSSANTVFTPVTLSP